MRIRTIKPDFWLHEALCSTPDFTRLMAIALLNWADDEGYFMAHPSLIRGGLFPFDEDSSRIPGALADLSHVGFIELLDDAQGRRIGRVVNFLKHQRVDRPQPSKIKPSSAFDEHSTNHQRAIADNSTVEWKGKGKGKGREEARDHSSNQSDPILPEIGQQAEKIVAAYRRARTGNAYAATVACVEALRDGADPALLLAQVERHATRVLALPPSDQRFCPGLDAYFAQRRFEDNPDAPPWFIGEQDASASASGPKKKKAPPDAAESAWLAAALILWPEMDPATRKADIPISRQRLVDATIRDLSAATA